MLTFIVFDQDIHGFVSPHIRTGKSKCCDFLKFEHHIHCLVMIPLQTHSTRMGCPLCCRFPLNMELQEVHCVVISSQFQAGASLCFNFLQHVLEENILHWKSVGRKLHHLRFPVLLTKNGLTCLLCNWYLSMVS